MDFYQHAGTIALGSRLRRLGEQLLEDAENIYPLYGVPIDAKWFPVFYVLSNVEEAAITELAQMIGHTHPSVSQIVKAMKQNGLVNTRQSARDGRVNVVTLTDIGKELMPRLQVQYLDVQQAVETLLSESAHNMWAAIAEMEFLLSEKSFFDRVQAARKIRERESVAIIDYAPEFREAFKQLNTAWIEQYFKLEEADHQSLNDPEEKILKPGGHILMARYAGTIVGTCALMKLDETRYELVKMCVTPSAQGKGIGYLLGQAAIAKAQACGAKSIYLESNTLLQPAIKLYQKLGFQKVVGQPSAFERCNIQMELKLN